MYVRARGGERTLRSRVAAGALNLARIRARFWNGRKTLLRFLLQEITGAFECYKERRGAYTLSLAAR